MKIVTEMGKGKLMEISEPHRQHSQCLRPGSSKGDMNQPGTGGGVRSGSRPVSSGMGNKSEEHVCPLGWAKNCLKELMANKGN